MVTIKIKTDNAAFEEEHKFFEVRRILEKLGNDLSHGVQPDHLFDANGNRCGEVKYSA